VTAEDVDSDVEVSESGDGQGVVVEKDEKDVLEVCHAGVRVSISSKVPHFLCVSSVDCRAVSPCAVLMLSDS
jgi:hypothetical protein